VVTVFPADVPRSVTSGRVPDPGIGALFRADALGQCWLDVEAALAQAQADSGITPRDAADAIAAAARLEQLDLGRVLEEVARTSHPLMPLVAELARAAGEDAGGWVHWGATTQNIVQTADVLTMRRAHAIFARQVAAALTAMADLADRSAGMVMAGRTHGQHAVPVTFGFKVAVWIDELARHAERLRQAGPRVFVAMLGGAVGTFASLGERGPQVQARFAARLGLAPMSVPARSIGDHLAEYVCLLGMLGASCGKIAREVYLLMSTETAEVAEPAPLGTVGSSTMPQKRNPQLCQDMIVGAAALRALVPLALEAMQAEHEGDAASTTMMHDAIERACTTAGDVLARLAVIVSGLRLDPARMRANLALDDGLIMAEAVMIKLAEAVGRQQAHEIVYQAAQAAITGNRAFSDQLLADPRITSRLTATEIDGLLDPAAYTGLSERIARETAGRARETARALLSSTTAEPDLDPARTWRDASGK
jgi:3-carboxy-cis,cis-muconate cycloisomerase